MSRVYIHEFIDVIGHGRARYMHHMTANWGPIGREQRRQLCAGVWGVVGSTGRWPQVVNLWEYASWDDLAHNFEFELSSPTLQDPALAQWWAAAAELRRGGEDRILVPAVWSPSIDDLCRDAVRGVAYAHELVGCRAGTATELLARVGEDGLEAYAEAGMSLVGAYRRVMADDDECVLIWAYGSWSDWAASEAAMAEGSGPVAAVRLGWRDLVTSWTRVLMADAEFSPLRTGRQPMIEDRRPLAELA